MERIIKTVSHTNTQLTRKSLMTFQGRRFLPTSTFPRYQSSKHSRFILNLPDEELASLERICFQVEQAYVSIFPVRSLHLSCVLVTGSTKILSGKRTQNSRHCHSKSSLQCCSMHVHFSTSGVMTTNKHSTTSCNIKLESLSAVQSCSTTHGRRFVPRSLTE